MNAINVIYPYKHGSMWVFDDERVGLDMEPFIAGADTLIDRALEAKGIEGENGFRLIFSKGEFPGYDFRLAWDRAGDGGNWYHSQEFNLDGWLCPALLKYFDSAPKEIYIKLEEKNPSER